MGQTPRAADIVELEYLLNNGGSFDELSDKAIEVVKRLVHEADRVNLIQNPLLKPIVRDGLIEQAEDLERVLDQIRDRKHRRALKKYRQYMRENKLFDADEEKEDD